jgi:hypothetical protein
MQERTTVERRVHAADPRAERRPPDAADLLAAHLHALHPGASPAMVQRSIDEAKAMFSEARVRSFLPILIERAASAALSSAASTALMASRTTVDTHGGASRSPG